MATLTPISAASPLDADDTTYHTFNNDTGESAAYALDNVDSDFLSMNTLSWSVVAAIRDTIPVSGGDDYTLGIRIVNGATILAAADAGGTFTTVTTFTPGATGGAFSTFGSPTAFAYVNQTANRATWDGANVEISQTHVQSKGGDGNAIQVDYVQFTGTYDGEIVFTADVTNFSVTGQDNAFSRQYNEPAVSQTYSVTGQDAPLKAALIFAADETAFTFTGQDAALNKNYAILADHTAYSVTGQDATITADFLQTADVTAYTVTGQDAGVAKVFLFSAESTAYTFTGEDALLTGILLEYLRPDSDLSRGSWTDQAGGTVNIYTAIDEVTASNADYIKSSSGAGTDTYQATLSDPTVPVDTGGIHEVKYRYGKGSAGGAQINLTVRLKEGGTTIATWVHNDVGAGWTDATQTLTAPQIASITNYNNVFVEFEKNQV